MLERFKTRALSHSQLASFEYDPEQWYQSYWLGNRQPATAEMEAGSRIGDLIGTPDSPVPELQPPGVKEYGYKKLAWNGFYLTGYMDHYCPDTRFLSENKTSKNKSRWTKGKAQKHDQFSMYCLLLNIDHGIKPEDIQMVLNFIPLRLVGVTLDVYDPPTYKQFLVTRTQEDIERYKMYIMETIEKMAEYAKMRDRLSTTTRRPPAFNGV
jgi:hypothetical protein